MLFRSEINDRLLCFGKLESMRGLIPKRKNRNARVKDLPAEHVEPSEESATSLGSDVDSDETT